MHVCKFTEKEPKHQTATLLIVKFRPEKAEIRIPENLSFLVKGECPCKKCSKLKQAKTGMCVISTFLI